MAAAVAHQVGTPLNLVSGYVQMLLAEQPEGSREAEKLRTVREQIGKVTTIVQGLLDQARRPVLERRAARAGRAARGAWPSSRARRWRRPRWSSALEVAAGLPAVFVDAGQLEQAFFNLITNSRRRDARRAAGSRSRARLAGRVRGVRGDRLG